MEERMLMAIGAGPDLEEIVSNDGVPLATGDVRHVSPRELTIRFDSTQVIDPATLSGIQISRSGGDGFFTPGLAASGVVNATSPTVFAGDASLSVLDDFYNGKPLTFTSGALAGQTATVADYIGASRTFIVTPPLTATPTLGDAFQVNLNTSPDVPITPAYVAIGDRTNEVVLRFADRLPDDFYRVHIVGSGAGALTNVASQPFNGGADLNVDFRLDLGTQVVGVVPQPVFRSGGALTYTNPNGGNGLDQIEVYFDKDALTAGAGSGGVQNPAYYQLIFTGATASTADDVVLTPASVSYFPANAMALLNFTPGDLGILDAASTVGTYRLRIGNATTPLPPPQPLIVPGSDPGSSFGTSDDLGTLGPAAQIIAGQTDVQPYGLTLPGGDSDPGHRQLPDLSHLAQGADATDGITTIYYDFRQDYGVTPTGAALTNTISPQQRDRVREALDIYSHYLGVQFIETTPANGAPSVPGSITIAAGVLSAVDPAAVSGLGGATAIAGVPNQPVIGGNPVPVFSSRLIVMDNADFSGSAINNFGQAFFRGVMRQVGVLLGFGSASDLPDLTINAPDPSLFGNTGEPVFPGDADILHGQYLYRPESNDIDLYRFTVGAGQNGVFTAETIAERLANSSSLDTVLSFYGDVTTLTLPRGLDLQDGYYFTLSDGLNPAVTYEFNSQNGVAAGRRAIDFLPTDTAEQIAAKVAAAIGDTPDLDVDPVVEGNKIRLLGASSLNILNAPFLSQSTNLELLARNDDYYSEDSYLRLRLRPGVYYVGVTSTGNTQFDPNLENSGFGGTTQGAYQLRLQFEPDPTNNLVDATGVVLDGDGDGVPGGEFNFWFQASTLTNTIYVDKAASNIGQLGTLSNPFNNIAAALAAAQASSGKDIIRIVANGGADGDVTTIGDNQAYEVGAGLSDGATFLIPRGTTVMMDPGVLVKLRQANIEIGSSSTAPGDDRSQAHLQVLGAPGRDVYFTSYNNEAVGADLNPAVTNPLGGDWGGLVFRNDMDLQAGRVVLENAGVFLNYVNHANLTYGGGELLVGGIPQRFNPLYMLAARPTVTNNTITASADAAVSADPNSFADSKFQSPAFTADYERIGPEIHGNRITGNSLNGLFIRVETQPGQPQRTLDIPARFDDTDIVHILTSNLTIRGNAGGPLDPDGPGAAPAQARLDARLTVDPGIIVKLRGARIETQVGAQLIAEGTAENPVLFVGLRDDRYGAGGTFDTGNDGASARVTGEWGGLYFAYLSHGSIDHARITNGGGETSIEGGFANFNPVEIHGADVRIANSTLEDNAAGTAVGDRNGRGANAAAVVFVRGAQPVLVNNVLNNNAGAAININVNSLNSVAHADPGRSTGPISTFAQFANNYGPLIRLNRIGGNTINGMEVRGGVLTTASVWDDTDVVHVLFSEVVATNVHSIGGLRLQSSGDASLVVKLDGTAANIAGITATGRPLDIDDRIGGSLHIVGTPDHPVVLTSILDNTVGAGLTPGGAPNTITGSSRFGNSLGPGNWRSVLLQQFANDRNVDTTVERELVTHTATPANDTTGTARFLGELAPDELSGDDNRRLGFQAHGYVNSGDVDVYSFIGRAGTEVWIDLDNTTPGLDSLVELLDVNGNVLARSNDSTPGHAGSDLYDANGFITNAGPGNLGRRMQRGGFSDPDLFTTNLRDAGMRVVLPFLTGVTDRYYVRVRSNSSNLAILDSGRTTGSYDLQVRLRETDETPGSSVQYSDIRFATNGIDIQGLPKHSPLIGDSGENAAEVNETLATALNVGNVLTTDTGSLSIAGAMASATDVDWYTFTLNQDLVTPVAGDRTWALTFDIDYADGLSQPDTVISVFDSTGRLIYLGRDSDVFDDRSGTGGTASALAGGSFGTLDALLGSIQLPAGQVGGTSHSYFVAVHSNGTLPTALNASFTAAPGAANELVRLEPIGSVKRIVEDHVGFTGYTSGQSTASTTQIDPQSPAILDISSSLALQSHVRPFKLSDVTLFVSTGTELSTVDPSTGVVETTVGALGTAANPFAPFDDIVMRSDGQLFGYQSLEATANTAGRLMRVDSGNAAQTVIGNDSIANATLNTDRVDAVAYNRTGVAAYDLYYSVRDGGGASRLFRGNPATGSAATAGAFGPLGEIRNQDPFGASIGVVSGMTFGVGTLAGKMFGVSDQGHLFTIDPSNGAATILTSLPGVSLQGLSLGPRNLDFNGDGVGGDLANTLFAIDDNGRLHALQITIGAGGGLSAASQAVFDTDNNSILEASADTGIAGATGLAFSPLDFNLWHPTFSHSADPGHGINAAPDNSRFDPQNASRTVNGRTQSEQVGGASFYFGLEQFAADPVAAGRYLTYANGGAGAAINAQYGILSSDAQQDLTSVAGVADTYNLAGGAYGSLVTDGFSLSGYAATDKPTLYFNYFLRTQNAQSTTDTMRDSARVFISDDNGVTWKMLATNNSARSTTVASSELPAFFSASSNVDASATADPRQRVQELFDTSTARDWRQARVDLGDFAGKSNLKLRFDFSTAGSMNQAGLPGDAFGNFASNERGQANGNEGFYVDDIVVGFAERGEMVSAAAVNSAFTTLTPNPNAAAPQPVLTGPYQLEIRRGAEFASSVSNASNAIVIDPAIVRDTNDRDAQGFTLTLPNGAAIHDGDTVTISDGVNRVVFEFNNDAFFSGVEVPFTTAMTAAQVATALRDAVNNNVLLNVTARTTATSGRVDLVGAADASLGGGKNDVTVSFAAASVSEAAGPGALLGTATRTGSLAGDLVVTLLVSDSSEALVPVTVTIPNGLASANFLLDAVDDSLADGVQNVVVTPVAAGYNSVVATLDVTDNETPLLSVTIAAPGMITENAGPGVINGTVSRNTPTLTDLVVQLFSSDTTEALVQTTVTILAGFSSANFVIDAVNDAIVDGLQNVTIAALASGFGSGTASLIVNDDGADTIAANTPLWKAEGPAPNTLGQTEGLPDGNQVSGAIHTVLAHPTDPNILYIGAVNGGIWRTTNATAPGGPTWTPLTDNLPSLSIGALEFDITDPSSQTLIAGIGRFSSLSRTGGQLTGLLRSTNGGDSWTQLADPLLQDQTISGVGARGDVILAAANNFTSAGGLFRSIDGGANFTLVSGTNGLSTGPVSDLVADPSAPQRFYAAVLGVGIFRTEDAGGTWTNVTPAGLVLNPLTNNNIEMAVHANPGAGTNAVYAGIMNNGQLSNLLRSDNMGAMWTALTTPSTNEGGTIVGLQPSVKPGAQGAIHFSIVADPLDPFRVYVGGDRQPIGAGGNFPNSLGAKDFSGRLFRVDASLPLALQATPLTHVGTASNSAPHADSREMVFNALGQIVETDDGGIFLRTDPGANTGDWYSLHGNVQVTEFHDIAYDANANTIMGGAQDTGIPEQVTDNGLRWRSVSTGDGGDVAIDDSAPGQSIRYSSFQFLGVFRRRTFDAAGNLVSDVLPGLVVNGTGGQTLSQVDARQFTTPVEINAVNPARLVIAGANAVYESFDRGDTLTNLGNGGGSVAMAYGGRRLGVPNPDVLWVGNSGNVLLRTTSGGSLINTPGYTPAGGFTVADLTMDPDDWMTAYVIDTADQVFVTTNGGSSYTNITGNLATLTGGYLAVQVIPGAAADRIVVGTRDGLFSMLTSAPGVWSEYGALLPNVLVRDIDYDARDSILVIGTQGRGAFSTTSLGEAGNVSVQILGGPSVAENAANPALTARISRTTTQGDLAVVLSSSNTNKATIAGATIIPDGQSFIDVPINVVDNALADGTQSVIISASAVGFGGIASLFDVLDDEVAALSVSIDRASVAEGAGAAAAAVTITRNTPTTAPLTVTLTSSDTSEATVPVTVQIPAGQSSVTVPLAAIDDLVADGTHGVRITAAAAGFVSGAASISVLDDANVLRFDLIGDSNVARPVGQLVIQSNRVSNSAGVGILVDAAARGALPAQPHPGVARNLSVLNTAQLAPSVTIENNVVSLSGTAGIRISGDTTPAGQPAAVIPFARVVNNTIYGTAAVTGIGIQVTDRASPTILNNIVANVATGVLIDASSQALSPVLGGMLYQQAATTLANTGAANGGLGSFPISLAPADLLFRNAAAGDFELVQGSLAIDSSINSVPERPELVAVYTALGMATSDVLAPEYDITGRLRGDNPFVNSPPAQGSNVFKDRGAIERLDPVKVTVDDLTVTETNASANAIIIVRLSEPVNFTLTLNYATADGTALAGLDYTSTSGTLTFDPGVTALPVTVSVLGDLLDEFDETFFLNLSNLSPGAVIDDLQGQVTIVDDEPLPAASINDVSKQEGDGGTSSMVFTVSLNGASGKEVRVQFDTRDGTATLADTDYLGTSGVLTFAPGQVTQQVTVQVIGNPFVEPDESFFVDLSNPVNATVGRITGVGTILDDEPIVSIAGVTVSEGSIGTTPAVFTVTLDKVSLANAVVAFATADQATPTAIGGTDYTAASGSITFAAGETSKTITVQVTADTIAEPTELFDVVLTSPINAKLSADNLAAQLIGTATILDDEPRISIGDVTVSPEGNSGTKDAVFTVLLDRSTVVPVSVVFSTADDTAASAGPRIDYAATTGTLNFSPGQTALTVTVKVAGDALNEIDETFFVNLSGATNSEVADNQAVGTIINDDLPPFLVIDNVSLTEGHVGTTNFVFTVALTAESGQTVTVAFSTTDSTATAGSDYLATSGTLTFNPGQTLQTITVAVTGDTAGEPDELFFVDLSNPVAAQLPGAPPLRGVGTILDDEPRVIISDVSVNEGDQAVFAVTLSHAGAADVVVSYTTADVQATAPADYTGQTGTLTFSFTLGETSKTITVQTINDLLDEPDETFQVLLAGAPTAVLADSSGAATILDDDLPPSISILDVSVNEGQSGTADAVFQVVLSGASGRQITASYATSDGTALEPGDYAATAGTITFAPGQVTQTLTVKVQGDTIGETNETFIVTLSSPANATLADAQAVGTILDDEPLVFIDDLTVQENSVDKNAVFVVRLDRTSSVNVVVNYATADGSAIAPADFTANVGAVTFAPNQTVQLVTVVVKGDALDEDDEMFFVNLTGVTSANIADGQAVGTILDDDPLPSLAILDPAPVIEGNLGQASAIFTVTLTPVSGRPVVVLYNTVDNTAVAGLDYAATSGTLTFLPGQSTQRITVKVLGDTLGEPNETFFVNLTSLPGPGVTNAVYSDAQGQGTISDDEPRLSIGNVSIGEPDAGVVDLVFPVTLAGTASGTVTVNFATADNTAVSGADFFAASGTLVFLPGVTQQNITISVAGDLIDEINETFFVDISNASSNAVIAANRGTGTINDNDPFSVINIFDASAQEGDAGVTNMVFSVAITPIAGRAVTVGYFTGPGAAIAGTDFASTSGTLTFAPGVTLQQLTVQVLGDLTPEFDEDFQVSLTTPVNGTINDGLAIGRINDDDARLTIADLAINPEGNVGVPNAIFTVSLTRPSAIPISVRYDTAAGTATADIDYFSTSGTVTFAPGETVQPVTVAIVGDLLDEADETFFVNLSQPVSSVIIDAQSLATIVDDDALPTITVGDLTVNEGDLGSLDAMFTVTLSAVSGRDVTVAFTTSGQTATSGADFQPTSGTLTFLAALNETAKVIAVPVFGDLDVEANETFTVNLANATNANIATTTATGTIVDDEPRLFVGDLVAQESTPNAVLPVLLTKPSGGVVTAVFTTADVTATAGADYTPTTGTLTFQPGETISLLNLGILSDAIDEPDETFVVNFSNVVGASVLDSQAQVTIGDDDALPGLTVSNTSVIEGDSGHAAAVFSVGLTAASGRQITASFATSDGTATSGLDFVSASGVLTFAPGETQQNVTVQVSGDTLSEADETFVLGLSNAVNANISVSPGTATILDDEGRLQIDDVALLEGDSGTTNALFNVVLTKPATSQVTVIFATTGGIGPTGATASTDFTATSGTLTFAIGQTIQTIAVPVLGDLLDEFDETFTIDLSLPAGALIADGQGVGTIVNDDALPVLSINSVTAAEGNSGSAGRAVFTASLSVATSRTVTARFATTAGTALASDFSNTTGTITFQPGQTTQHLTVNLIGDSQEEPDETFTVTLSNVVNGTIGVDTGLGTIRDDDARVSIADLTVSEGDATTNAVFDVTLSKPGSANVLVSFSVTAGTALDGQDFTATSGTLTFTPGQISRPLTVPILGDLIQENTETFNVTLAIQGNTALPGDLTAVGTILDNDAVPAISVSDVQLAEGNAGSKSAVFNVTLNVASALAVNVVYTTADGSAIAGSDYIPTGGTLTFAPGTTVQQVSVSVLGDTAGEASETFSLNLSNAVNSSIADGQGVATILNDDIQQLLVTGADAGGGPHVKVYNSITGQTQLSFFAYAPNFNGGVRVATGDVNGDGQADIITAAGKGGGPHVRVFDGRNGADLGSFFAFEPTFTKGIYVATGDVNGDGKADIIVGTDGGPGETFARVRIFDARGFAPIQQFDLTPATGLATGVRVAAGDVNGDGKADVILASAPGAPPRVVVRDAISGGTLADFLAYGPGFTGGVYVAAGDFDGDGRADIITGAGAGGGPHVRVFSGANTGIVLSEFFAYGAEFSGGVRVGSTDYNGDNRADIAVAAGPGGGPHVRVLASPGLTELTGFMAYGAFAGGVFVGGGFRTAGSPLQAATSSPLNAGGSQLTLEQALPLVNRAVADWTAAGLDQRLADRLRKVEVRVADLPDGYLGMAYPNAIVLDRDAAGRGWFLDSTPWLDDEYDALAQGGLQARQQSAAAGGMDLLTVLAHELGHTLGLDDQSSANHDGGLMSDTLGLGVRRHASQADVDALFAEGQW